ncbi:hypothetical protein GQ44DRAFT_696326 [Phaeosphaeriaceae sp. PMI808]|nr:hypothetical protein GQ44DRAFT_696326 [Phaeosphaeriaceae sp. PMI808]
MSICLADQLDGRNMYSCLIAYVIKENKMTIMVALSGGHWKEPERAHGDKKSKDDLPGGGNWRRWEIKQVDIC